MRRMALMAAVGLALCLGRPAFAAPGQGPFADVPTDHWAYDAVNELAALGIFNGYPDSTFGGKRALTRYEFAVALQRMTQDVQRRIDAAIAGIPKTTPTTVPPPPPPGVSRAEFDRLNSQVQTQAGQIQLDEMGRQEPPPFDAAAFKAGIHAAIASMEPPGSLEIAAE